MERQVLTGPVITFLWESAKVLSLPRRGPPSPLTGLFMGQSDGPEGKERDTDRDRVIKREGDRQGGDCHYTIACQHHIKYSAKTHYRCLSVLCGDKVGRWMCSAPCVAHCFPLVILHSQWKYICILVYEIN